jgi:hypothetical protein
MPPEQILEQIERREHPPVTPPLPHLVQNPLSGNEFFIEEQARVDALFPWRDNVESVVMMEQREHYVPDRSRADAIEPEECALRGVAIQVADAVLVDAAGREDPGHPVQRPRPVADLEAA